MSSPTLVTQLLAYSACEPSWVGDGRGDQAQPHEVLPLVVGEELRLAAAGWLGGFGNPTPLSWLACLLAGAPPENTQNMWCTSAPLYRLFSRMVWVWGWVCKGGGGSATFQEHPYLILQVALPSEAPIKTKTTKHRITTSDVC